MKQALIALSGARPDILERCPTERGKFLRLGGAVLVSGMIAGLCAFITAVGLFGANIVPAVLIAVPCGLLVLGLDRRLVSVMKTEGKSRWWYAFLRLAFAVPLSALVALALTLQVFGAEIGARAAEIERDLTAVRVSKARTDQEALYLRASVAELEVVVASRGAAPLDRDNDATFRRLAAERDRQRSLVLKYYVEWQCRLHGGPGCRKAGQGPLARQSKAAYDTARDRAGELERRLEERAWTLARSGEAAQRARLASATEQLAADEPRLHVVLRRQADQQTALEAGAGGGTLLRLRVLMDLPATGLSPNVILVLLFILVMSIESLPVAARLTRRPGDYEKVLAQASRNERSDVTRVPLLSAEAGAGTSPLYSIWSRSAEQTPRPVSSGRAPAQGTPRPPRETRRAAGPYDPVGEADVVDVVDGSLRDMALRKMASPRFAHAAAQPGGSGELHPGYDLFPDDD
ncbi:DUF4407 domain-containing protein [Sphaerisporangium dianthi]|uniref:DUF4407 domain-containing protein n=1 Tax=Sphaerisporangium dianthi TaxID=1436120 RepID=A0ABV9CC84_9ACTN